LNRAPRTAPEWPGEAAEEEEVRMHSTHGRDETTAPELTRRELIARLGAAGAVAAFGPAILTREALAQAKAPADPPGTVPNSEVLAEKDPALKPHSERPLTASLPAEFQAERVTPSARLFIRNNLFTPELNAAGHAIKVGGLVEKPLSLSLDDLRRLGVFTQQAMLECAGSGRTAFNPVPRGTPWPPTGGMGCPRWTGVSLGEVLRMAGVRSQATHVAFIGADFGALPTIPPVVRSIPMSKAMERHTMIVFGLNDGPLPKVHGFPVRMLVPGWAGSASTKWLRAIEVLDTPFKGPYMDESYRIPAEPVAPGAGMPANAAITEGWPIKSMITQPAPGARFPAGGPVLIAGKAWIGEGEIDRVELSFNEGVSWVRAALEHGGDRYAWRIFSYEFRASRRGYHTVLARATDGRGNTQPLAAPWNPLGYFWNGWHRVGFVLE